MVCVGDIVEAMERWAPSSLADEDDNVGLLLGFRDREVKRVLVALDADSVAVGEAIDQKADMIVCHHPRIYLPTRNLADDEYHKRLVITLAEHKVALFSAHTNLDWASGGINDILCELFGLSDVKAIAEGRNGAMMGRIGSIEPTTLGEIIEKTRNLLGGRPKYVGEKGRMIKRVALCGGGGDYFLSAVLRMGADLYISSDFRYHVAQQAHEEGLALIDAGHFETENVIVPAIANYLKKVYNDIDIVISSRDHSYFKYE